MSVVENKLVQVDYDGNGTFDLGFFRGGFLGNTQIGQLAAWLLTPGTGLPSTQALVDGTFTWAFGDLSVPGDGFIPGFGNSLPFAPSAGAFFFAPDFNGDGKTDQGFASEDDFTLFSPPNPPAFYELATWLMDGTGVTFQDFLRDSQGNIATVLAGSGDDTWADSSLYLAIGGQGPLGDFDNDDDTDILFLRRSPLVSGETQIAFWIIENGVVTAQQILGDTAKADWSLVNTNDLNADGITDLIFAKTSGSQLTEVGFWTMSGTQITNQGSTAVTGDDWMVVDTNDFNGDGTADIAFFNTTSREVAIWTMNGTSVTDQAVIDTVADGYALVDHNDFNGDGKADLLFKLEGGATGDKYAVWLLDGTGTPLAQSNLQVGGGDAIATDNWEFVATGDTDGGGNADIVFYNTSTGEVGSWLLNGVDVAQQQVIGTVTGGFNAPFVQGSVTLPIST